MADMPIFVRFLHEIQSLSPDIHLLCPRDSRCPDGYVPNEPTSSDLSDAEQQKMVEDARKRRLKYMEATQDAAGYNEPQTKESKVQLRELLGQALSRCDLCIHNYYTDKMELRANLNDQGHGEDEIEEFFKRIDSTDVERVIKGLHEAYKVIMSLPPKARKLSALAEGLVYSLFEALSCDAFLRDEELIRDHLDDLLRNFHGANSIRSRAYLPAATSFLFVAAPERFKWASAAWRDVYKRSPDDYDWNWAIKSVLEKKFELAQQDRSSSFVWSFWNAMRFILQRLSPDQITHKLGAITPSIHRLALEHLAVNTSGLKFILETLTIILEKTPQDFWSAMQTISATTVVEQIFSSPCFAKLLQETTVSKAEPVSGAAQMISWIWPFMSSLRPANLPPACEALAAQLFRRATDPSLSVLARSTCYTTFLKVFSQMVHQVGNSPGLSQAIGRVTLASIFEVISKNAVNILQTSSRSFIPGVSAEHNVLLVRDIISSALYQECSALKDDYQGLLRKKPLKHGVDIHKPELWSIVIESLREADPKISETLLKGISPLCGLEMFVDKRASSGLVEAAQFNETFAKITKLQRQIFDKISDFAPEHLDHLFKTQESSKVLVAGLFASDEETCNAAKELVKNVSGEPAQKEALSHLLRAFTATTLASMSWCFRIISHTKTFASIPRTLKTGMDVLDILSDTQTGLLRTQTLEKLDTLAATEYWSRNWQLLKVVFQEADTWNTKHGDLEMMTELCRDAMQYAEALFEQYDVFAGALKGSGSGGLANVAKTLLEIEQGSPASTLIAMSPWLRLKDEYLSTTLANLITKSLRRLSDHDITIPEQALEYIKTVATTNKFKTRLSAQQKAGIVRALSIYYKHPIATPVVQKRQASLAEMMPRLTENESRRSNTSGSASREQSIGRLDDSENAESDGKGPLRKLGETKTPDASFKRSLDPKVNSRMQALKPVKPKSLQETKPVPLQKSKEEVSAFLEIRRKETEARKARDRDAAAKLRGKTGLGELRKDHGSALAGLGVLGKDHNVKSEQLLMPSDSEEEEDQDAEDIRLFGSIVPTGKPASGSLFSLTPKTVPKIQQGPVKKVKRQLQKHDMRARLAPDLSNLHQTLLGWEFFADSELPPDSVKADYTLVSNKFATVLDYQNTFEPLLILEGWQSFRRAREEGNFKVFEIKVSNRLNVDSSIEVSTTMSMTEAKELGLGVADVILLSKDERPDAAPDAPHCLARVKEKIVKKGVAEIVLRVNSAKNPLLSVLAPGQTLRGVQILSLTPLEREYGALKALTFYDLSEEIMKAKPSPILSYPETALRTLVDNYQVNTAQARAVRSALDNDAFTLIQGPPGSGKTKTICALVGAMMTDATKDALDQRSKGAPSLPVAAKKILVCAPSNAAVDELVMRFKNGVTTLDGRQEKLSIVRLGRSDAINSNIKDVTLEELVKAKLNLAAPRQEGDINSVMMEHKAASEQFHLLRTQNDARRARGEAVVLKDTQALEGLKRTKAQLSLKIDAMRDKQKTAARDAELERRRIQQSILDGAHVLCATLSGSGHDIFQSLNIEFETVIIDEAAQSIELAALIPLKYGCSKCILVGDPKQLPPTVLSKEAARFQFEQSLFARMEKNHPKDIHLLDTQYRMHPEISQFPSKTFYESRLKDGANMAKLRARPWHNAQLLGPYRFFDVQGMSASAPKGHSLVNLAELEVAMKLYDRLITDCKQYKFHGKIGIITPYKGQLKELRTRFTRRYGEGILSAVEFNTTDAFQGRESEVIIFSCVRATTKGIGFLSDIRRMNVGLTRAKCSLWVLGNSQTLMAGEFWKGLITDAKARNLYTDGDLSRQLSRPLLTQDMMRDDVEMGGTSPIAESRGQPARDAQGLSVDSGNNSVKRPVSIPPAQTTRKAPTTSPIIKSSPPTMQATLPKPTNQSVREIIVRRPSVPNALNESSRCRFCGSNAHFTHNCDNVEAQVAVRGLCQRCKSPLHYTNDCKEPRCLACGDFGHDQAHCQDRDALGAAGQHHVRQQEAAFVRSHAKNLERRQRRAMGDHDPQIPVIQSTLPADIKRKRQEQYQPGAPRGPKFPRPGNDPSQPGPTDRPGVPGTGLSRPEPNGQPSLPGNRGQQSSTNLGGPQPPTATPRPGLGVPPSGPKGIYVKKKDSALFSKKRR